jgi:hypothetical protein
MSVAFCAFSVAFSAFWGSNSRSVYVLFGTRFLTQDRIMFYSGFGLLSGSSLYPNPEENFFPISSQYDHFVLFHFVLYSVVSF